MYSPPSNLNSTSAGFDYIMKPAKDLDKAIDQSDDHSETSDDEKVYKVRLNLIPIVILEAICLGCLGALAYFLRFHNTFPVYERSFNPFDPSLSIPLKQSRDSRAPLDIQPNLFYTISLALPLGVVLLGELAGFIFSSKPRKVVRAGCIVCKMHKLPRRIVRFTGAFLFGLLCTSILTDCLKLATGRHRPYFLEACGINVAKPPSNGCIPLWVRECNTDEDVVREARLSFPSFYASVSAYCALFTMTYIHCTLSVRSSRLLRPSLVLAIGGLALVCGCSRVAFYRNHWEDVAVGFLLGGVIGVYMGFCVMGQFREYYELKHKTCCKRQDHDHRPQPLFFRYFRIPHVSYQGRSGRSYAMSERNHYDYSSHGVVPVNEAFQRDLHQRVEDYSKRHGHQQNQNSENYKPDNA